MLYGQPSELISEMNNGTKTSIINHYISKNMIKVMMSGNLCPDMY